MQIPDTFSRGRLTGDADGVPAEAPGPRGIDLSSPAGRLRAAKGLFLLAAGFSFLISIFLWFLVDREQGLFVGLWVPSILSLGGLLLAGRRDVR